MHAFFMLINAKYVVYYTTSMSSFTSTVKWLKECLQ